MSYGDVVEGGEGKHYKESYRNFQGGWIVYYLDCSDGFMGVYLCENLANCSVKVYAVYCSPMILQEGYLKIG